MKKSNVAAVVLSLGLGVVMLSGCGNDYVKADLDRISASDVNIDDSSNVSDTTTNNTVDDNNNSVYDTSEQAAPVQQLTDPQIGDTEDQVLNSTWGSPTDKTETKDAYGTSAMWFYDGMKSIFFVDGKVNSISQ